MGKLAEKLSSLDIKRIKTGAKKSLLVVLMKVLLTLPALNMMFYAERAQALGTLQGQLYTLQANLYALQAQLLGVQQGCLNFKAGGGATINAGNVIKTLTPKEITNVLNTTQQGFKILTEPINKVVGSFNNVKKMIEGPVVQSFNKFKQSVDILTQKAFEPIAKSLKFVNETIAKATELITKPIKLVQQTISKALGAVTGAINQAMSAVNQAISQVTGAISQAVGQITGMISKAISQVAGAISQVVGNITGTLNGIQQKLFGDLMKQINQFLSPLQQGMAAISAATGLVQSAPGLICSAAKTGAEETLAQAGEISGMLADLPGQAMAAAQEAAFGALPDAAKGALGNFLSGQGVTMPFSPEGLLSQANIGGFNLGSLTNPTSLLGQVPGGDLAGSVLNGNVAGLAGNIPGVGGQLGSLASGGLNPQSLLGAAGIGDPISKINQAFPGFQSVTDLANKGITMDTFNSLGSQLGAPGVDLAKYASFVSNGDILSTSQLTEAVNVNKLFTSVPDISKMSQGQFLTEAVKQNIPINDARSIWNKLGIAG